MSIWTTIRNTIVSKVSHAFTETEHLVLTFGSNLLAAVEKNGGPVLVEIATSAVAAAEAAGGSGKDKFNAAVASVTADLVAKGEPVIVHAVEGAILMAVANLKPAASE